MLRLLDIKNRIHAIEEIVYPKFCRLCSSSIINDHSFDCVCKSCLLKAKLNTPPFCKQCGIPLIKTLPDNRGCSFCRGKKFNFDEALSAYEYSGVIKECISLFKYEGKIRLAANLGQLMADFFKRYCRSKRFDYIVCVPLYWRKKIDRGFNQAEILAEFLSRSLSISCCFDKLRRIRKTSSQFNLNFRERHKNISGAFACKDLNFFVGKSVLLVDDIFTTGATLNECSKVLKQAGALKITAFTLAR